MKYSEYIKDKEIVDTGIVKNGEVFQGIIRDDFYTIHGEMFFNTKKRGKSQHFICGRSV